MATTLDRDRIEVSRMTAQDFIDEWGSLIPEALPPKKRKGEQNRMLAEILGVSEATVLSWGRDWNRMPQAYERVLDAAHQIFISFKAAESPSFAGDLKEIYESYQKNLE